MSSDRIENDGDPKKDLIYRIDELEDRAGSAVVAALVIASAVAFGMGVALAILAGRWVASLIG